MLCKPSVVARAHNPSNWKVKAGGSLIIRDWPGISSELKAKLNSIAIPYLKKPKKMSCKCLLCCVVLRIMLRNTVYTCAVQT